MNVLEATNWSLEEAINLQFATGGDLGGGAGGAAGAGAGLEGGAGVPPLDEEEVRAPMPVMRDRLYGDVGMHGVPAGGGIARWVASGAWQHAAAAGPAQLLPAASADAGCTVCRPCAGSLSVCTVCLHHAEQLHASTG